MTMQVLLMSIPILFELAVALAIGKESVAIAALAIATDASRVEIGSKSIDKWPKAGNHRPSFVVTAQRPPPIQAG